MKHPVIEDGDIKEVNEVLRSGNLSLFRGCPAGQDGGPKVQSLEAAFRDYFKVKWAVAFNSATAALHAACVACRADITIVSPFTFVASASCVLQAGGKVEWCDIDENIFCMDVIKNQNEIWARSSRTNTIIPVHLMGHSADMDAIMWFAEINGHLRVIEDCCQAIGAEYHGRKVGTIGDCGVFSFNQSKTVSTGEGGMLITDNDWIARVARAVRNHGEVSDPELKIVGYNYRMTEYTASLALSQFKRLDAMNDHRRALCQYMSRHLDYGPFEPPIEQKDCKHVYYTYALKYHGDDRDEYQQRLIDNGVFFGRGGYVKPLYHLPIFGIQEEICPVAERMHQKEIMVTDIFRPPMTYSDCDHILEVMKCQLKK